MAVSNSIKTVRNGAAVKHSLIQKNSLNLVFKNTIYPSLQLLFQIKHAPISPSLKVFPFQYKGRQRHLSVMRTIIKKVVKTSSQVDYRGLIGCRITVRSRSGAVRLGSLR